ncbi:MAG: hypothetical protein CME19_19815 [Gemmatimonadetes bacterium]|nr:hypothetical protein [Gemmatimonadota bacterium]|tara:strand:- start:2226 stop:2453 length:228 start_codon:yes stop_codon:yes gene_type:complete
MDLKIISELFDKKVDSDAGSILFTRPDITGLPDKVLHSQAFTVEIKDERVYLIDIYNSDLVLGNLISSLETEERA